MLLGLHLIDSPDLLLHYGLLQNYGTNREMGGASEASEASGVRDADEASRIRKNGLSLAAATQSNIIYNRMLNLSTNCKRVMFGKSKLAAVVAALTEEVSPHDLTPVGSWRRGLFGELATSQAAQPPLLTKSTAAATQESAPVVDRAVHDLDFITTTQLSLIAKALKIKGWESIKPNRKKISFKYNGVPIDIFYCHKSQWAFGLLAHTGDALLNKIMRRRARDKFGLKLNQYGFFYKTTNRAHVVNKKIKTERDIFDFLQMEWRDPRDRNYVNKEKSKVTAASL